MRGKSTLAKAPAKAKNSAPAAQTNPDAEDFALRSLQQELEQQKRFDASDEQMLHFYEQMLLIRRFEERAGQL